MDRLRPRSRPAASRGRAAERELLRLRHRAAAIRRRAGPARLRAGTRSRATRPPRRGCLLDVRREPRPAGDLAGRLRARDGARPGRGAAPARRGRVRGPRRPRHDRGQRRRPRSRPGGGGVAGGARRRHRDRGDAASTTTSPRSTRSRPGSSPSTGSRTIPRRTRSTGSSSNPGRPATTATGTTITSPSCSRTRRARPSRRSGPPTMRSTPTLPSRPRSFRGRTARPGGSSPTACAGWATSRSVSSTSGGCRGTADPLAGAAAAGRPPARPRGRCGRRLRRLRHVERRLDLWPGDPVHDHPERRQPRSARAPHSHDGDGRLARRAGAARLVPPPSTCGTRPSITSCRTP